MLGIQVGHNGQEPGGDAGGDLVRPDKRRRLDPSALERSGGLLTATAGLALVAYAARSALPGGRAARPIGDAAA
jgi:hypothetical protein